MAISKRTGATRKKKTASKTTTKASHKPATLKKSAAAKAKAPRKSVATSAKTGKDPATKAASSLPATPLPTGSLPALTRAGLKALRTRAEAGDKRAGASGRRATAAKKIDKALAAALDRLEANYERVLR